MNGYTVVECRKPESALTPPGFLTTIRLKERTMAAQNHTSITDLAWAAGFLEGEGSFGCHGGSTRVSAGQVQKEPLDRLMKLFGGRLTQKKPGGLGTQPLWIWVLPAKRSAAVMMTLYSFMSPRRKGQIEESLSVWRKSRLIRVGGSDKCTKGHDINGDNARFVRGRKYPTCKQCRNEVRHAWRKRTGKDV